MKVGYPTEQGDITALLEFEFFGVGGDAGQTTPRLRHARVTWNNIGAGQTWSNFMDPDVFPNQIDYWGPTGMVFYRNQKKRWRCGSRAGQRQPAVPPHGSPDDRHRVSLGQREDIDGTKGQDYRIQFSLKVDFSLSNIL